MKIGAWTRKAGFQIFVSLKANGCFGYELEYAGVKHMKCYRKVADKDQKYFMKNIGKLQNMFNFANWIKNQYFSYYFMSDYEKTI